MTDLIPSLISAASFKKKEEERKKKPQDENIMACPITYGGHNYCMKFPSKFVVI